MGVNMIQPVDGADGTRWRSSRSTSLTLKIKIFENENLEVSHLHNRKPLGGSGI
jgi:hypothetical protein